MTIVDDGGAQEDFLDGGLLLNNPVQLALGEALTVFGGASKLGCLISIGTGHPGTIGLSQPDAFQRILPTDMVGVLKGIATDCEQTAHEMAERFRQSPNRYFRFNVNHGVGRLTPPPHTIDRCMCSEYCQTWGRNNDNPASPRRANAVSYNVA